MKFQHIVFLIFVYSSCWQGFWNLVYILFPPREKFNSPGYDKFLDIVSYYGSLNIRSAIMKVYGAAPQDAPPIPKPPTP